MNVPQTPNSFRTGPDESGHFGMFGGRFVAETLMPLILELEGAYEAAKKDSGFHADMASYLTHYVGRPSPLYFAERLTEHLGGAKIYFKREELNHTGAHKVNNVLGQILLARRMGKKRIIAETGAGQHGVATATAAALFGLECQVYMGEEDLAQHVDDLVRAGMVQLLALEVDLGSTRKAGGRRNLTKMLGHPLGVVERARAADVVGHHGPHLGVKGRIRPGVSVGLLEIQDQGHQGLGDEASAEFAEMPVLVGTGAEGIGLSLS